jgi:CubicO group peptidase (beta-lactamase class C family)
MKLLIIHKSLHSFSAGSILAMLLLFGSSFVHANSLANKIETVIKPYVSHHVFSGAVLVAKNGKVVYQQGHGLGNREWKIPNTPQVKFQIASMTKSFTAALVLKLVEQGKLSLDDTISQHLPEFDKNKGNKITIAHILGHRTGFPRAFAISGWFTSRFNGQVSNQEFADVIGKQDLLFEPGSEERYTNLGYFLLGLIIKSVTGQTYEQVLQQQLLTPLNLVDTGIAHHSSVLSLSASGYQVAKNGGYKKPSYLNLKVFGAGSAMYSTVQDLFKWDQALYGTGFLNAESKKFLFGPIDNFGFHVLNFPLGDGTIEPNSAITNGELHGFSSVMTRFIDDQHTIILLSNNAINSTEKFRLTRDIAKILYNVKTEKIELPISFLLTQGLVNGDLNKAINTYRQNKSLYALEEDGLISAAQQQLWSRQLDNAIELLKFTIEQFPNSLQAKGLLIEATEQK